MYCPKCKEYCTEAGYCDFCNLEFEAVDDIYGSEHYAENEINQE